MSGLLVISPEGCCRCLVGDVLAERYGEALGEIASVSRNSHVETWSSLSESARQWIIDQSIMDPAHSSFNACLWWADMSPVGGPVLGPFCSHGAALQAEREWLILHDLPV